MGNFTKFGPLNDRCENSDVQDVGQKSSEDIKNPESLSGGRSTFTRHLAVKIGTPTPLPVNGLLPKVPPIGLNFLASLRVGEQQVDVLRNMPDFNRRYAISGGIVKLLYSTYSITLFVRILPTLFKKFPYRDFRTILYFLNGQLPLKNTKIKC